MVEVSFFSFFVGVRLPPEFPFRFLPTPHPPLSLSPSLLFFNLQKDADKSETSISDLQNEIKDLKTDIEDKANQIKDVQVTRASYREWDA